MQIEIEEEDGCVSHALMPLMLLVLELFLPLFLSQLAFYPWLRFCLLLRLYLWLLRRLFQRPILIETEELRERHFLLWRVHRRVATVELEEECHEGADAQPTEDRGVGSVSHVLNSQPSLTLSLVV